MQALDEIYLNSRFEGGFDVRYEDDGEGGPDFRIYSAGEYVAAIEVRTFFQSKDFEDEVARNARLVEGINSRVRPTNWWVSIEIDEMAAQPKIKKISEWLRQTVLELGTPRDGAQAGEHPRRVYEDDGATLSFRFFPRLRREPASDDEPIIVMGPSVFGFPKDSERLRVSLTGKTGGKYDLRDKPFAVAVCFRDGSCGLWDIVNALYGDKMLAIPPSDSDAAQLTRASNGLFAMSRGNPEGRNRRLSCVFAVMPAWHARSGRDPKVYRFDNPFAHCQFPPTILRPDNWFMAKDDGASIQMVWDKEPNDLV
ncbi:MULTISPECIES: hypothetical protein [Amycolatopsis]|uniref:Uncharacterized protein n=1 Tax=Amycolatopsis dongchuanensis TaxID=1070866 RepID=A0ABP9R820_9PSEU